MSFDFDTSNNVRNQGTRYNTSGLWNPSAQARSSTNRDEARSFGFMPEISNVTSAGFDFGWYSNYEILANLGFTSKNPSRAGSAARIDISPQMRGNLCRGALSRNNVDFNIEDISLQLQADTGKIHIWDMPDYRLIRFFLGSNWSCRGNMSTEVGIPGFDTTKGEYGIPVASASIGMADPLQIGGFHPFKQFNYIMARSTMGNWGDNSAYQARSNTYQRFEVLINTGAKSNLDINAYYKRWICGDGSHHDVIRSGALAGREENYRVGLFSSYKNLWTVQAEGYNSPMHYAGDPYGNHFDFDASLSYRVYSWTSKDYRDTINLDLGLASTEIRSWIHQGYWRPPMRLQIGITGNLGTWNIFGNFNVNIKGKKYAKGAHESQEISTSSATSTFTGIAVNEGSGSRQLTSTVTAPMATPIAHYSGNPKITVGGDMVVYQKRTIDAPNGWHDNGVAPREAIYVKSVKIIDKAHGRVYGLNASGKFELLTGRSPATAPDLTGQGLYLNGRENPYNYDLPKELFSEDEILFYDVVVEYGLDTSKLDNNALMRYDSTGTVVISDPDDTIDGYYRHFVAWPEQDDARGHWPAHNWDTVNNCPALVTGTGSDGKPHTFRPVEKIPYDPTKPYDPDPASPTYNNILLGLKRLKIINLDVVSINN